MRIAFDLAGCQDDHILEQRLHVLELQHRAEQQVTLRSTAWQSRGSNSCSRLARTTIRCIFRSFSPVKRQLSSWQFASTTAESFRQHRPSLSRMRYACHIHKSEVLGPLQMEKRMMLHSCAHVPRTPICGKGLECTQASSACFGCLSKQLVLALDFYHPPKLTTT
jgi:hypothetical protein